MTKKIKISDLKPFDMAEHLDSEAAIARQSAAPTCA